VIDLVVMLLEKYKMGLNGEYDMNFMKLYVRVLRRKGQFEKALAFLD